MYLSELLTTEHLAYIMESIERVHAIVPVDVEPDFPIYDNYCRKLQQRYTEPFYATYPHSRETYVALYDGLREYETHRKGKLTCIHGDAVLSNILLDCDGKIQLIDMRGKVGSTLSIYGDWLYDWAKLYQSLVGYDVILQGKVVSHEYASRMRQFFENEFRKVHSTDDWENLKLIAKSLLFTLLPLHNNEKCIAYYNLIQTIP
jgi:thiamine kinase-like enzyme